MYCILHDMKTDIKIYGAPLTIIYVLKRFVHVYKSDEITHIVKH